MAVAALPWKDIVRAIPTVVSAARTLWNFWASRPTPQGVDPRSDVRSQLEALAERVAVLEGAEAEQTRLLAQLAEQLQAVARRAAASYWLSLAALALGAAGVALALLA